LSYTTARERLSQWEETWPAIAWDAIESATPTTVDEHLRLISERLRAGGLPLVLARVMTGPGDPISVVRVLVPGTEYTHLDRRRCGPAMTHALERDRG
jgi:ribosomal protein S12 methylthiotransferase accessory factor